MYKNLWKAIVISIFFYLFLWVFMSFIFLQIVIFQLLLMIYNLWYSDFQSQPHYVFYKKKITSFMSFILIPFFFLEHFLDDKNVFSKRNTNFIHSICTEFARIWNCLSSNQCASQRKKQKYEKEKGRHIIGEFVSINNQRRQSPSYNDKFCLYVLYSNFSFDIN